MVQKYKARVVVHMLVDFGSKLELEIKFEVLDCDIDCVLGMPFSAVIQSSNRLVEAPKVSCCGLPLLMCDSNTNAEVRLTRTLFCQIVCEKGLRKVSIGSLE